MKLATASLCAVTLLPACAFADLYAPGVKASFSSMNRADGNLFGSDNFTSFIDWNGMDQWDGITADKSAAIDATSSTYPVTAGAPAVYNAVGRTQAASAYVDPSTGRLGVSASSYVNMIHSSGTSAVYAYGYADVWARAEVADNITVTGNTPVQVTFRMSMHGTQGFTDTGAASMNGYIGVSTDGNVFNGENAAIAFDGANPNGALIDQILSYTTLLQPGSTLAYARFDVSEVVTFDQNDILDPGAFSDGMNTATVSMVVAEADLSRVTSANGLLIVAVPEPTILSGTFVAGMLLLRRSRRAIR